ncbi:MAG: ArsR family transcriptional regulator, partial [Leptospiraceae bacterium]|nr:ArsR family transcriptional regulator [Leptospiraceae bacterium]
MRIEALVVIKALADETRMRILAVLSREPLNVQEIQRVLNLKQSRVSRHLKIMERAGLLEGHREGAFVYYKYHQSIPHTPGLIALFASLGLIQNSRLMSDQAHWPASNEALLLPDEYGEDLERLEQLLEERRAATIDHFEQLQTGQEIGQQELVDSNYYRQGILRLLPDEPGVVADLGCGGGELSAMLARRVGRLICIDQSANMLERARRIIDSPQVEFRLGAIEHLPLGNAEARTVIASMVLHHVPDPDSAIREIVRVLAPGGRLILVELE